MAEEIKKILTQDPSELEAKVLQAIFKKSSSILDVIDVIDSKYFTIHDYGEIYECMVELYKKDDVINCESVLLWLEQNGRCIDPNIVKKLFNQSYTAIKVAKTAKILKELFIRRSILEKLHTIIDEQVENPTSSDLLIERINNTAMDTNDLVSSNTNDTKCCSDENEIMADIDLKLQEKVSDMGLRTDIPVIDNQLRGLLAGKLWCVVADSQVGKSAFAIQIMTQALLNNPDIYVEYYSLEMTKREVEERAIANISGIEPRFISDPKQYFIRFDKQTGAIRNFYEEDKNHKLVHEYKKKLRDAIDILHKSNCYIDDTPDLDMEGIVARIKKNNLKRGRTDLVIIDHMCIACSGTASEVVGKMDDGYNKLKQIAKKLGCTVIALHQFSNELKNDPLRKPNIFSLRGSSAPRHYCDVICGIWRPDVYRDVIDSHPELKGHCDIDWQKVRYTAKPPVTLMSYNGYKFTEKEPDETKGATTGDVYLNVDGSIFTTEEE